MIGGHPHPTVEVAVDRSKFSDRHRPITVFGPQTTCSHKLQSCGCTHPPGTSLTSVRVYRVSRQNGVLSVSCCCYSPTSRSSTVRAPATIRQHETRVVTVPMQISIKKPKIPRHFSMPHFFTRSPKLRVKAKLPGQGISSFWAYSNKKCENDRTEAKKTQERQIHASR